MHGRTAFRFAPFVALLLASATHTAARAETDDLRDAQSQVRRAAQAVSEMIKDVRLYSLLLQARGVFIVPQAPKDADMEEIQPREGVLLAHRQGAWSSPAFYDIGTLGGGAQTGMPAGSMAMILMSDKALNAFKRTRQVFALNARAGLSIVHYSASTHDSAHHGDVIVWTSSRALEPGTAIGFGNVRQDEVENETYYMRGVTVRQILSGTVQNPHAWALRDTLPTRIASN